MAQPAVRQVYREFLRHAKHSQDKAVSLGELRSSFRAPVAAEETLDDRLKQAESRLSFLRMSSNIRPRGGKNSGKWIYKDGQRLEAVNGTLRDGMGRVISNWDGKNLDPSSVSTHRKQLKRMGFKNNTHAKGFF